MRLLRRGLLPTGSAVLVCLAANLVAPVPSKAAGPLGGSAVIPAQAPAPEKAQWGLHLKVGDSRVYRISSVGAIDVDYGLVAAALTQGLGSAPAMSTDASRVVTAQYDVSATLHWRVVGQDATGYVLSARLQDVAAKVDGAADSRRALLEAPFLFRLAPSGAIASFTFAKGYPAELERTIRGIVEPLQVVFPAASLASWQAQETGAGGSYNARYTLVAGAPASATQVTKSKTHIYGAPMTAGSALPVGGSTAIGVAGATISLDPAHGTVLAIDATEDTTTQSGDTFIAAHTGRYTAQRVTTAVAPLASTVAGATEALADDSFARARLYDVNAQIAPRVQGLTLSQMLAVFDLELGKNQASAHLLLKSYLRLHPADAGPLARSLDARGASSEDPAFVIGFAAIAAAGHHEAQVALVDVLTSASWSAQSKERALISIMDLAMAEPFVLKAVWTYRSAIGAKDAGASLMQSIATNVYGALGNVALGNPSTTNTVVGTLASLLQSATDARQRVLALDALTNVGDFVRIAPLAAPHFTAAEPAVRIAAFVTFRRMGGEAAFTQFAKRFAAETAPAVLREAAIVARDMPESAARTAWAKAMAAGTTERELLMPVVQILGRELAQKPGNEAALRGLLETCHDRQVRRDLYAFVTPRVEGGAP